MVGQAKPGPELASLGINISQFCSQFNNATKDRINEIVPAVITVYADKTFSFILKTAPTSFLLKKVAKIPKGSANSRSNKVATISVNEIRKIAEYKLPDLNANSIDAAVNIIKGTAKNMGIVVE